MSTNNIHFYDKIRKFPKISLIICFYKLSDKFFRTQKQVESAKVKESSVLQSLKFYCSW